MAGWTTKEKGEACSGKWHFFTTGHHCSLPLESNRWAFWSSSHYEEDYKSVVLEGAMETSQAICERMSDREGMIRILKHHLKRAQDRIKAHADKKRSERENSMGDWIYLKLQPYRQGTVVNKSSEKLSPRFFGPYEIVDKIGKIVYKLRLPPTAQIHPVFHVSQLKKAIGTANCSTELPMADNSSGDQPKQPATVLEHKMVKRGNKAAAQVLVHWVNTSPTEATWEYADELRWRFP
ncbi:hypothetical protein CRG98_037817 [Punica granatum]|uniref:Tf2-1-like SH3-like domain-containing protein n=1 Tax=Punica granatum TaxID=22663 RepID=A0A2I0ICS1_PUNGR|nr:hypothetical protein CRG98_037817 [Punica granatum]